MQDYRPTRDLLLVIAATILSFAYAFTYFWGDGNLSTANLEANGRFEKPFIYRALMPFLARSLGALTGWRVDVVVTVLVILSGVAFVFALRFFLQTFYRSERSDIIALAFLAVFIVLFEWQRHVYDFPTAIFFSVGLALIARGRITEYLAVFGMAAFNRETTIFLTLIFALYFGKKLNRKELFTYLIIQVVVFTMIQGFIRWKFHTVPGNSFTFDPLANIQKHLSSWITVVHLMIMGTILRMVLKGWMEKPLFLRMTFVFLFPVFFLMYLLLGYAFEYRVFAEIYSTTALLALPTIPPKVTGIRSQSLDLNEAQRDDQLQTHSAQVNAKSNS